jgi:hypothetical protein
LGKEKMVKKNVGCQNKQTNKRKPVFCQNVHNLFHYCCQDVRNKERSGVEGRFIIIIINGEISPYDEQISLESDFEGFSVARSEDVQKEVTIVRFVYFVFIV